MLCFLPTLISPGANMARAYSAHPEGQRHRDTLLDRRVLRAGSAMQRSHSLCQERGESKKKELLSENALSGD